LSINNKNLSYHLQISFLTLKTSGNVFQSLFKAEKVPHPRKIKKSLEGKREISLKKLWETFPEFFCVKIEI
jgi:hypothetical protein